MQTYNVINNELTGAELPGKIYENLQSLKSEFSGAEFPTENLVAGMTVFRTDQNKVYRLLSDLQTWRLERDLSVEGGLSARATNDADGKAITSYVANVEVGSSQGKIKVTDGTGKSTEFTSYTIASQTEAETGTDNTKGMTPLGTKQSIDKQRPLKTFTALSQLGLGYNAGIGDIATAMPDNSVLYFAGTVSAYPNLELPSDGIIEVQKNTVTGGIRFLLSHSNNNGANLWMGRYASWMTNPFSGWKKVATTDDFAPVIWQRNNYYRGKSLGTSLTTEQSNAIRNGTFDDIYVGDYWTIGGVVYRIVAIDYYYNCGDTACTTHHVVVVPDTILYSAQMNTSNVVTGGYVGSAMYTSNLNSAKTTILNAFGSGHILTIRQYFSNAASSYVTGGTWADANVWLMNEINVYGCSVFANLVNGTNWVAAYTIDNCQYPAFRANPRLIHTRQTYWLRDVADSATFAFVYGTGTADSNNASNSFGVRPAFCVY